MTTQTPKSRGCRYCSAVDAYLVYSEEFNVWVHEDCLRMTLRTNPSDQEACIMADELDLPQ